MHLRYKEICEMEDRELITVVRAGDRDAFGMLVDRYQGLVYSLCLRMTGNVPDAKELAHESFVEAYLKLDQLRDPAKFRPWLKQIALNLCRMWYRRRKHDPVELSEEPIEVPEEKHEDPSLHARMSYGLSRLSAPHRLVLVLHYLEGLSYEEIAQFLTVPVGTVMSRLHRARNTLKKILDQTMQDEEIPMIEDERFKEEVHAEIAVLLEMFREQSTAMERLTVILRRSPERFAQLIKETEDQTILDNLAAVLPHLGSRAVGIALDSYFSSDPSTATHAGVLLQSFMARCERIRSGGWGQGTASIDAYILLDSLIKTQADEGVRAELLLELMEACEDETTAVLFTNVLLCYPDAAFPLLMARFRAAISPEDLYRSPHVLYALCRTGTRFCDELLKPLGSQDTREQLLALAGVEAVARSLGARHPQYVTPTQFANDLRTRSKWPPLRTEDMDEEILQLMIGRTAALLTHESSDIRGSAIRALGNLKASQYLEQIRSCASHDELSTRLTAINALAEIGDIGSVGLLTEAAREGESAERLAAIKALGRLQVQEARPLLIDLLDDPDKQVQLAAVNALGEIGGGETKAILQGLLRSPDKQLRKAAAKALYRGKRTVGHPDPSEITMKRVQKTRGQTHPVAYISLDAAIRYATPELRSYEESDLTAGIARVCSDYSSTRRYLIDYGLMSRTGGVYEFTELGESMWHVEHFIMENYLTWK